MYFTLFVYIQHCLLLHNIHYAYIPRPRLGNYPLVCRPCSYSIPSFIYYTWIYNYLAYCVYFQIYILDFLLNEGATPCYMPNIYKSGSVVGLGINRRLHFSNHIRLSSKEAPTKVYFYLPHKLVVAH